MAAAGAGAGPAAASPGGSGQSSSPASKQPRQQRIAWTIMARTESPIRPRIKSAAGPRLRGLKSRRQAPAGAALKLKYDDRIPAQAIGLSSAASRRKPRGAVPATTGIVG